MRNIFPNIKDLVQHLQEFKFDPCSYRPDNCPHCGHNNLWGHGCYYRKSDRRLKPNLNPIPIPRFFL